MPPGINEFVEDITGIDGVGVSGVEEVEVTDDNRVGVIFDEDSQVGVQMAANENDVQELGRERVDDNRMGMVAQEESFFDDPMTAESDAKRIRPADIGREPDGEFTFPENRTSPAPESPARRGPNGRFVSDEIEPVDDIGRQDRTGLFDLF